jgi:xanthine dehydrogenase accessory factor
MLLHEPFLERALKGRGVAASRLGRLKAPAGLDLGAVTPEEIAVSILAEIVQTRRAVKPESPADHAGRIAPPRLEEKDPVCGMLVEIASARYHSEMSGRIVHFCCAGCKGTFDRDPQRYTAALAG